MRLLQALLLAAFTLVPGCVLRAPTEERQVASRCYLRPSGRTANTTITLAGKQTYTFTIKRNRAPRKAVRYGIAPDTYRVTVLRKGKVILKRVLFIADGETRELPIR
jgi:hypothetical protein